MEVEEEEEETICLLLKRVYVISQFPFYCLPVVCLTLVKPGKSIHYKFDSVFLNEKSTTVDICPHSLSFLSRENNHLAGQNDDDDDNRRFAKKIKLKTSASSRYWSKIKTTTTITTTDRL